MHSLPESYRPALQTITAAERASTASGGTSTNKMKPDDLMNFFIEEAQHHIINAAFCRWWLRARCPREAELW